MYKKVTNKDVLALEKLIDKTRVFIYDDSISEYSKDELGTLIGKPEVIVKVESTKEVSKVAKYAYDNNIPLTVRGSGTGLVGACVPLYGGIVLDMTLMNKIINLDEENQILEVEAGALLMDIADYTKARGYLYAPDPGEKSATIGGNITTNAGGMRAVKYGVTRDWVRALEVVLMDGTILEFGKKVVKDTSGYSLKNLIIGSEGTLAIVTKAYLKVVSLPEKSLSLLVPYASLEKAIEQVPKILNSGTNPTAIEFFTREALEYSETFLGKKFPDQNSPAYILLTFDGSQAEVDENAKKASELLINKFEAVDVLIVDTDERNEDVWSARSSFLEAIKASTPLMDECDVVVPRSEVSDYIKYTYELEEKYGLRLPSFGHAGDGNLHIYICKDDLSDEEWEVKLDLVFHDLYKRAKEVGGLVSGEHGIGYAKMEYLKESLGDVQINLMRNIKAAFDPKNLLNPGKIV
ncbi:MAG TPA: FAD-binding oxidoreductase [Acholeplasmataceae bacterium]|jgi:glycolate oxidase|nr:FAD-binding oxidoreductase [Acholeplasmataceae bacterium]